METKIILLNDDIERQYEYCLLAWLKVLSSLAIQNRSKINRDHAPALNDNLRN